MAVNPTELKGTQDVSDFSEAQQALQHTDKELWLGTLVLFSISETRVKHEAIVKLLFRNGLKSFIPRVPDDADVFRRVASAASRKKVPTSDPNIFERYLVRDIPGTSGVLKKIVCETVDVKGETLEYQKNLCDLRYDRQSGQVVVTVHEANAIAVAMAEQIKHDYAEERGCLNSNVIRDLLRRILDSVNATNVRKKSGGVYFVSRDHLQTVEALEALAAEMSAAIDLNTVPLLDDGKRREMIRRAFESECTDEINRVLDEIAELNKAGKPITSDKFKLYVEKYSAYQPKLKEYETLLEDSVSSVNSLLKVLQGSLVQLSTLHRD